VSQENVNAASRFFGSLARNVNTYWEEPRSYAAEFEKGESDPAAREVLDQMHPDIRWEDVIGQVREGKLAYAKGADELLQALESYSLSVDEVTDLGGDRALVVVQVGMTGRSSGVPASMSLSCVITLRDGLVSEIIEYASRSEALKAAGLESEA
jgi:ketosteroid isomerase-like protein